MIKREQILASIFWGLELKFLKITVSQSLALFFRRLHGYAQLFKRETCNALGRVKDSLTRRWRGPLRTAHRDAKKSCEID